MNREPREIRENNAQQQHLPALYRATEQSQVRSRRGNEAETRNLKLVVRGPLEVER
jgi:hypothetical protein